MSRGLTDAPWEDNFINLEPTKSIMLQQHEQQQQQQQQRTPIKDLACTSGLKCWG